MGDVVRMHYVSVKKAGQGQNVHQFFPVPQPLRPHPPQ